MKNTNILKCLIPLLLINQLGFGQTATFLSNFEDQSTSADIGVAAIQTNSKGTMYVVENPNPDLRNSSGYVLKQVTGPGVASRAEYCTQRITTNENHVFYTYDRYHPESMFDYTDASGTAINQFKSWPCEAWPFAGTHPQLEYLGDSICENGGIFNDMVFRVEENMIEYRSRAWPGCNRDYYSLPYGEWVNITLEIYWTTTENGYYRVWLNDKLWGYSDHIKTLFGGFEDVEEICDIMWSAGTYGTWHMEGDSLTDSLICYIDNMAVYEADNGVTIADVCPECETAPAVQTDSNVYKININHSIGQINGYNNSIKTYGGDTNAINLSSTFGRSNGIDIYLWSDASASGQNSLADECFPEEVIQTSLTWLDTVTHVISLKELNPNNSYTIKLLSATKLTGDTRGVQIWTTEENRDTVFAYNNLCGMAEITNLSSDANGDMKINAKTIGGRGYINAIEIIEIIPKNISSNKKRVSNELNIFPNPVKDNLYVKAEAIPSYISIYSYDGRNLKYAKNTNTVHISDLKSGVYIVLIDMQKSLVTRKIIKE
jgi:hypothetical protein